MKFKTLLIVIIVLGAFSSLSGQEQEIMSMTLEDCILKAMEGNLTIAVEVYNPRLADASVTQAKEIFFPQFDLAYGKNSQESPSYWWLQGEANIESRYSDYSAKITQLIPTGGNVSLSWEGYRSETNEGFQLINPRYGSTLQVDFTQPLLKDFGPRISRREILIAQNNQEISQNQFRTFLMDTIYSVQEAYWNLVYAIEDYKVKQQSLQLARDLLAKNRREVEVGKLAPLEILNAETEVAQREAEILQAAALIKSSEDVLKNILNLMETEGPDPQKIRPLDDPRLNPFDITLEKALQTALHNRPDLMADQTGVETKVLNMGVAKNQMLPGLDLTFSYWSPGISGDRILYQDGDPFLGIVIGKEQENASQALRDAFRNLYTNWSVGLTLSVPLSNLINRSEFVKARMELEQGRLELESRKKQIVLEVRDAVRAVETNAKRVEAYRLARELAERRLRAEEKKLSVGLATNYFVLQYQEELANARSMEIKALVDYNLALAQFEKVVGISLLSRNIQISRFE